MPADLPDRWPARNFAVPVTASGTCLRGDRLIESTPGHGHATMPDGMWGPTIPEVTAALPGVPMISRTSINAWDDPNVRVAIEKTGRKQILIAGVSLEVCAGIPVTDYATAGVEMLHGNDDPKAQQVYADLDMPFADLVWKLKNASRK
ncbi:isochorismatase family protein [Paraburkholderia domus]|nr:isochorismatase family protein [Paraburkholderia domus]